MKILITFIAIGAVLAAGTALASPHGTGHGMMNTGGGSNGGFQQGYSGTAAGAGSQVSKTGFVKERTNEEDHMDGKEAKKDDADKDETMPTDEQDDAMDNEEKEDTDSKADGKADK